MRLFALWMTAVAVTMALLAPVQAQADDMYWTIKNQTSFKLNYKFYVVGQNLEWPGGGQVYYSYPDDANQTAMQCEAGTQICLGAWEEGNVGRAWGLGASPNNSCTACCYTCEHGFITSTTLTD